MTVLGILAITSSTFAFAAEVRAHPNVILIVGDDMGWNDFAFMGSKTVHTPNIDKLASESAVFPNGYVPSSLCRASLATLLTGLYAHQHKICCNDPPEGVDRSAMHPFIREAPTIPRLLGQAGYESFQTGKFWEGHYSNAGFTDGMTTKGRHGDDGLVIGRQTMQPIYDFIDKRVDRPFFVWYAPMLPHQPHNPPQRLLDKYLVPDRDIHLARYYAMCEWFDETVGQLVDYLDRRQLRKNTLLVFVIDNGWIQQTGGKTKENLAFAPRSKRSPYDGGVRTPIVLSWPGAIPPGRHDDLVSTVDIAPTVLAACNVSIPDRMPGASLLNIAKTGKSLDRDAVFGEIFVHTCVDIQHPGVNLTHRWVRQGPWKLIVPAAEGEKRELFKVSDDPFETDNLADRDPDTLARLQSRLDSWWKGRSP